MFCPQCGQQQVTGVVRFCSRCGFPLDGVIHLLGSGGALPLYHDPAEPIPISARRKGVKQGGVLFLSGAVVVSILGAMASYGNSTFFEVLAVFAAILCFVGGPLRMLYAAVFEEGAPRRPPMPLARPYVAGPMPAPQFGPPPMNPVLAPPPVQRQPQWRPRPVTAELIGPPSVTEGTTRLLDKEDRAEPK